MRKNFPDAQNFPDARKLSGWQRHDATMVFGPLVETLTDVAEQDTLDTGFSETGSQARATLPSSDTLESLDAEKGIESLADDLLLVSLQETLDGRFGFGENPI